MKILKKINKGFILTVIVILLLCIYLNNVEKQRETDKSEILKACEQYIDLTEGYIVLPEEMQKLPQNIEKQDLEKYKQEIKTGLKQVMIQNDPAIELQYQILDNIIENDIGTNAVTTKFERTITSKPSYEFDGDQVTVSFKSNVTITEKYLNEKQEEKTRSNSFSTNYDEIILQKVEGQWKIVYSNLQFNKNGYYTNSEIIY